MSKAITEWIMKLTTFKKRSYRDSSNHSGWIININIDAMVQIKVRMKI